MILQGMIMHATHGSIMVTGANYKHVYICPLALSLAAAGEC